MTIYNTYIIYKIINKVNNKIYIGQTIRSLTVRWSEHVCHSKTVNSPLYKAMRYHDIENFSIEPICSCFDIDELNLRETFFILLYQANTRSFGYNCDTGGRNKIMSEITKEKIRKYKIGVKQSPELIEKRISKLRGRKNPSASERLKGNSYAKVNIGSTRSNETKRKMSENHCSKQPNWVSSVLGRKHSDEAIEKFSGKNHYKYDQTLYDWINILDNIEERCTRHDLQLKYFLSHSALGAVVSSKRKHHKGWSLKK